MREHDPDSAGPRTRVAMLHMGRCGSTVLARMLRQHDPAEIEWDGEVFERQFNGDLTARRDTPPLDLLRDRLQASRARIYGFETKCHPDQHLQAGWVGMGIEGYLDRLRHLGFERFIILRRHNYLSQLASFHVGWARGQWHTEAGQEVAPQPVTIDPRRCGISGTRRPIAELFAQIDDAYRRIDRALASQPVLHLAYESDIERDPRAGCRRIQRFLGLPDREVGVPLARSNPFALRRVITNFEQIAAELRHTPYAWMLEAAPPPEVLSRTPPDA